MLEDFSTQVGQTKEIDLLSMQNFWELLTQSPLQCTCGAWPGGLLEGGHTVASSFLQRCHVVRIERQP